MTSAIAALVALAVSIYNNATGRSVTAYWMVLASFLLYSIGGFIAWNKKRKEFEDWKAKSKGPSLGVEYTYSDRQPPGSQEQPLVIRNLSVLESAHNVKVMPVVIGDLKATFEPEVIPFIGPQGSGSVKARIVEIFPTLRHDFPILFKRKARTMMQGGVLAYPAFSESIQIEYENAEGTRLFETTVAFNFRGRHEEILTGETRRRIKA